MRQTGPMIDAIIEELNDRKTEYAYRAVRAFDVRALPVPLEQTYLSVTPDSCKTSFFEDDNSEYCEKNEIAIRINCFTPITQAAYITQAIAEEAVDVICDTYPDSVCGFSIGDTEYDSKVKAYKLTCIINFSFEVCAGEGASSDALSVPKNFFCKTHVLDSDIHVTGSEKEMISEAFITGTYTGTGDNATQDVFVGFPPRIVIVFRTTSHVCVHDSASGKTVCRMGVAFKGNRSSGMSVNTLGFYVYNIWDSYGETRLNDDGVKYAYIAFK